jgi:hypothetical protein
MPLTVDAMQDISQVEQMLKLEFSKIDFSKVDSDSVAKIEQTKQAFLDQFIQYKQSVQNLRNTHIALVQSFKGRLETTSPDMLEAERAKMLIRLEDSEKLIQKQMRIEYSLVEGRLRDLDLRLQTAVSQINRTQKSKRKTEKEALSESGFDNTLGQMESAVKTEREPMYANEGEKLYRALSDTREKFLQTGNSDNFVRSVQENVKKSEPVLNKSPVWKQFLLDILNAVIFIFTLGISYMVTGRVRLFTAQPSKESEIDEVKTMRQSLQ